MVEAILEAFEVEFFEVLLALVIELVDFEPVCALNTISAALCFAVEG